jgi:hypothetical protein
MSGGESNPPSIRARYGVLGHTTPRTGYRGWVNWQKKHRKRLAAIYGWKPKRRKTRCKPVT